MVHVLGQRAEQGGVLQRLEDVPLDRLQAAATDDDQAGRGDGDHESEQARNRLAAAHAAVPQVDTGRGLPDAAELLTGQGQPVEVEQRGSPPGGAPVVVGLVVVGGLRQGLAERAQHAAHLLGALAALDWGEA